MRAMINKLIVHRIKIKCWRSTTFLLVIIHLRRNIECDANKQEDVGSRAIYYVCIYICECTKSVWLSLLLHNLIIYWTFSFFSAAAALCKINADTHKTSTIQRIYLLFATKHKEMTNYNSHKSQYNGPQLFIVILSQLFIISSTINNNRNGRKSQ